jgi:hypothetical protein
MLKLGGHCSLLVNMQPDLTKIQAVTPSSFPSAAAANSGCCRHLLLLGALVDEGLVDVGDHTTTSNGGLQQQQTQRQHRAGGEIQARKVPV